MGTAGYIRPGYASGRILAGVGGGVSVAEQALFLIAGGAPANTVAVQKQYAFLLIGGAPGDSVGVANHKAYIVILP